MKDRKVKQICLGYWYQQEGEGHKERMKDSEYGRNIVYSCMKIE
jgi:hypothetical protein